MTDFAHPELDAATASARTLSTDSGYQQRLAAVHAIFLSLLHTTEYKADYIDGATVTRERADGASGRLFTGGVRLQLHRGSHIIVSAVIDDADHLSLNVHTSERTLAARQQFDQLQPYIAGIIQGALATAPAGIPRSAQ